MRKSIFCEEDKKWLRKKQGQKLEGFYPGGFREMQNEDAMNLKPKQMIIHRRYGACIVREVIMAQGELFGVVVRPVNQNGQELLRKDSGCDIPDFLEDYPRSIENPPAEPGENPIDHLTAWGTPKEDMPQPENKNHFAPENEGVPE